MKFISTDSPSITKRRAILIALCMASVVASSGCRAGIGESHDLPADDVSAIWQAVLDEPSLQTFLHLDDLRQERIPLVLVGSNVDLTRACVYKGGAKVSFVSRIGTGVKSYFKIDRFEVHKAKAEVEFTYAVEGLRGSFALIRDSVGWRVESAELSER